MLRPYAGPEGQEQDTRDDPAPRVCSIASLPVRCKENPHSPGPGPGLRHKKRVAK